MSRELDECRLRGRVVSTTVSQEGDADAEDDGTERDEGPDRDAHYADERVVRGPVDGEHDQQVEREQADCLRVQLGVVLELAGGRWRPVPVAGDELGGPEGDGYGAEHNHDQ